MAKANPTTLLSNPEIINFSNLQMTEDKGNYTAPIMSTQDKSSFPNMANPQTQDKSSFPNMTNPQTIESKQQ